MEVKDIVSRDPEVVSGALVFTRTRVPVQALVDYLSAGRPLDEFLDDFPGVKREQAVASRPSDGRCPPRRRAVRWSGR